MASYFSNWSALSRRAAYMLQREPRARQYAPKLIWLGIGVGTHALWSRQAEAGRSPGGPSLSQSQPSGPSSPSRIQTPEDELIAEGDKAGVVLIDEVVSQINKTIMGYERTITRLQTIKQKLMQAREEREIERESNKLYLVNHLPTDDTGNREGPSPNY